MRVAIIGAGWFGCHIACKLLESGYGVTIFEKNHIFAGASGNNQNRLHLGYHYPRSGMMRQRLIASFYEFMHSEYAQFTRPVVNNLYAVAKQRSLIDFKAYLDLLMADKLSCSQTPARDFRIENVEGVIYSQDRLVLTTDVMLFFKNKLSRYIFRGAVDQGWRRSLEHSFDFIIDCTNNSTAPSDSVKTIREDTVMFEYRHKNGLEMALTVMDGPFFSLYPTGYGTYTLSSVEYTPKGYMDLAMLRNAMEKDAMDFLPWFRDEFVPCGVHRAHKTKVVDVNADSRELMVHSDGKVVSIFSGKFSDIFEAERKVKEIINA